MDFFVSGFLLPSPHIENIITVQNNERPSKLCVQSILVSAVVIEDRL